MLIMCYLGLRPISRIQAGHPIHKSITQGFCGSADPGVPCMPPPHEHVLSLAGVKSFLLIHITKSLQASSILQAASEQLECLGKNLKWGQQEVTLTTGGEKEQGQQEAGGSESLICCFCIHGVGVHGTDPPQIQGHPVLIIYRVLGQKQNQYKKNSSQWYTVYFIIMRCLIDKIGPLQSEI